MGYQKDESEETHTKGCYGQSKSTNKRVSRTLIHIRQAHLYSEYSDSDSDSGYSSNDYDVLGGNGLDIDDDMSSDGSGDEHDMSRDIDSVDPVDDSDEECEFERDVQFMPGIKCNDWVTNVILLATVPLLFGYANTTIKRALQQIKSANGMWRRVDTGERLVVDTFLKHSLLPVKTNRLSIVVRQVK
eukprot:708752_1